MLLFDEDYVGKSPLGPGLCLERLGLFAARDLPLVQVCILLADVLFLGSELLLDHICIARIADHDFAIWARLLSKKKQLILGNLFEMLTL